MLKIVIYFNLKMCDLRQSLSQDSLGQQYRHSFQQSFASDIHHYIILSL